MKLPPFGPPVTRHWRRVLRTIIKRLFELPLSKSGRFRVQILIFLCALIFGYAQNRYFKQSFAQLMELFSMRQASEHQIEYI